MHEITTQLNRPTLGIVDPNSEINGILLLDPEKKLSAKYIYGQLSSSTKILKAFNESLGYGVFSVVNQSSAAGRAEKDITHLLAFYVDLDTGTPDWSQVALHPSSIVESSPGKQQAYWRLGTPVATTEDTVRAYLGIQHSLVKTLGGDLNARDVARVLRTPGYLNTKYPSRPLVRTLYSSDATYSFDQVGDAYGSIEQPKMVASVAPVSGDEGRLVTCLLGAINRNPPPDEPHTWNAWLYRVSCWAIGNLGLSVPALENTLLENLPDFDDEEILRTVRNAGKYARRQQVSSGIKVEL